MQHYELLLLIDPGAADRDLEGVLTKVRELLGRLGAAITKEDPLGKRKLAYPIRKQTAGTYHALAFDAPSSAVAELDRALRLSADVLRHLVVTAKIRTAEELQREEAIRAKIDARRRARAAEQASETSAAAPAGTGAQPTPEPQTVNLEQLDKKLEHILEETPDV